MSAKQEMKELIKNNKNKTFTATELCKILKWKNTNKARSIAKKYGAKVDYKNDNNIHLYSITL